MAICINCGKEIVDSATKPRKYCSDSCRKRYIRKKTDRILDKKDSGQEKTDTPIKFERFNIPERIDFSLKEQLARKYPSLTVMERLFYRPSSELGVGEFNFVSKPGCACYGVYE